GLYKVVGGNLRAEADPNSPAYWHERLINSIETGSNAFGGDKDVSVAVASHVLIPTPQSPSEDGKSVSRFIYTTYFPSVSLVFVGDRARAAQNELPNSCQ